MTVKEFFEWSDREYAKEMHIMRGKGEEYTVSDKDKLKNFKSIADRLGMSASEVAMVYLLKHMDSIRNFVLNGVEASDEPISGRIRDARNYLMLLHAIILEERGLDIKKLKSKKVKIKRGDWVGTSSERSGPIKFTMVD